MVQARDIVQWQNESLANTKLWVQTPPSQGKPDMVTWCYKTAIPPTWCHRHATPPIMVPLACKPTRNGLADMLP